MSDSRSLALPEPGLVEEKSSINFSFSRTTWIVIGAASLVMGLLAMGFTFLLAPQFVTTRTFLVLAGSNPQDNSTVVRSFQAVMTDKGFATELKARADLDLPVETIQGMISVASPSQSALLIVRVQGPDLAQTEVISEQIAPTVRAIIEADQQQLPIEQRIPGPIIQELYTRPIKEQVFVPWYMGLIGGAVLGFVLSYVTAAIRHYRKPVITSARDVGDALDLPVLARLPAMGDGRNANPQDAVLGMLAAIERIGARGPIHRLVVVGPEADLERSKLILALGCAIARNFDQPVALVDADLEHGSLTKLIGASDEPGLAECLTGELRVDQTLLRLENGHTPTILAGMVPPSGMIRIMPAGLNRGGSLLRMRSNLHQVLGALSGRYVVVVDGPQVPGPVPSTQLLSLADATLVVVTEGSTPVRDARFTGDALRAAATGPVGAVILKR
jgi:Mrp family chromosome partitioning ATPase/capsular polysaccharide biosynthesis protein